MLIRCHGPRRSTSRDGLALVIVLAFIVLASVLLTAFLVSSKLNRTSTASYSQDIRVQEVAQGGMQDILSDLHAEIVAGSIPDPNGMTYTSGTNSTYIPSTNYTAVPARFGYTSTSYGTDAGTATLSPTLVRVSRASQDGNPTDLFPAYNTSYYTNTNAPGIALPVNRASAAPTDTASANGRSISIAKWNRPMLLASCAQKVPSPFVNAPPDWIYVTQAGSRACVASDVSNMKPSTNLTPPANNSAASPVVGRYAYAIYDEGALLDANCAGYPSTGVNGVTSSSSYTNTITGLTLTLAGKSYLGNADLTQLPGLGSAQTLLSTFVNWRNAGSLGTYSTATSPYLASLVNYDLTGFLNFVSDGTTASDSPLVGRQDLINYFANIDSNFNTPGATCSNALTYLGTFSRAVNAPSWFPTLDASAMGGINGGTGTSPANLYAYHTNCETAGYPNRDLPNVRFTKAGTITHYTDSTGTITYAASVGDPLIQRRFSMARIDWITHTGPSTSGNYPSAAAAIQSCFGLAYDSANFRWQYVGSQSSAQSSIETLDQVAAEQREPNFFELLKAGILSGSLGRDPGVGNADSSNSPSNPSFYFANNCNGVVGLFFNSYSAISDTQVIQIGANIIDQYHTDSYPTAIYFPTESMRAGFPEDILANTCYGVKNLPYVTRLGEIGTGINAITGWIQPELWNPYQANASVSASAPTNFCARAYGSTFINVQYLTTTTGTAGVAGVGPSTNSSTETFTSDSNAGQIFFQDSGLGTTSSVFYPHPHPLLVSDTTGAAQPTASENLWSSTTSADNVNQFAAFFCGTVSPVSGPFTSGSNSFDQMYIYHAPGNQFTVALEYLDPVSHQYLPYGLLSRLSSYFYHGLQTQTANPNAFGSSSPNEIEGFYVMRPDPRTDRFSGSGNLTSFSPAWGQTANAGLGISAQTAQTFRPTQAFFDACGSMGYPVAKNADGSKAFTFNSKGASPKTSYSGNVLLLGFWAANESVNPTAAPNALWSNGETPSFYNAYYADPDGLVRPGDDSLMDGSTSTTGDGVMLLDSSQLTGTSVVRSF
jgi:hypothetical protein